MFGVEDVLDHYRIEHEDSALPDEVLFLCPFHDDQTLGSSFFNTERELYHCFSCGAGGSLTGFVATLEECSYPEARRLIQDDFRPAQGVSEETLRARLQQAMQDTRIPRLNYDKEARIMVRMIMHAMANKPPRDVAFVARWVAICTWAHCPGIPQTVELKRCLKSLFRAFLVELDQQRRSR